LFESYVFQQRRDKCSLEFRRCTLVAIGLSNPGRSGNFSSAYLLQTKGAFLEFCRKATGARDRARFRYLRVSGFATDCPLLRFKRVQYEPAQCATIEKQMNVEKTIEFILDQQAKTEALWQRNEERWQRNEENWKRNEENWKRNEERWKRADERMDKFDRSLVGIRKLILLGAKTLVSSQKAAKVELREIREDIRELTAAQSAPIRSSNVWSSYSAAAAPTAATKFHCYASAYMEHRDSSRLCSRISSMASRRFAKHASRVRPCPFAPGTSAQYAIESRPS
jgi:hypothetical protein